jgi:hypothetical protein
MGTFVKRAESLQVCMLPTHPPTRIASPVATETQIFTVYQDDANDELRFRQAFGWMLQSTTARSYNSSGNIVGGGFGDGVSVGGGHISFKTQHKTDLVMLRRLDSRGQKLRDLEQQYHNLPLGDPGVSVRKPAGIAFGAIVVVVALAGGLVPIVTVAATLLTFILPPAILYIQSKKKERRIKRLEVSAPRRGMRFTRKSAASQESKP